MGPDPSAAPGGVLDLVASFRERVCELRCIAPDDLRALGRPVHVRPEEEGRTYRRILADEVVKLRSDNHRAFSAGQAAEVV